MGIKLEDGHFLKKNGTDLIFFRFQMEYGWKTMKHYPTDFNLVHAQIHRWF